MAARTRKPNALSLVIDAILDGEVDDGFDAIYEAIKERHRTLDRKTAASLKVGDKIRFTDRARPAYIRGATGKITSFKGSKVVVQLDRGVGRFGGTAPITTPVSIIEKVK